VILAYGDHDWSNRHERDANHRAIPAVHATTIRDCGHFSSLEKPAHVSALIQDFLALPAGTNIERTPDG
jgi:pimeloyl-ACP methyl ester carboxylesterase